VRQRAASAARRSRPCRIVSPGQSRRPPDVSRGRTSQRTEQLNRTRRRRAGSLP
jgi:hypothetical protein